MSALPPIERSAGFRPAGSRMLPIPCWYSVLPPFGRLPCVFALVARWYVEIKYAKNKISYKSIIPKSIKELKENEQLLLILGSVLSEEEKLEIKKLAQSYSKCNVVVWDYNDLFEKISYEPDYVGYLVNPQRALVEDAILSSSDPNEQEEIRKERIELLKEAYRCQNVTLF